MPAPFGFGVGDFIAVATLINNIRAALKTSGGARDEYQELERELALLELALRAVKTLTGPTHRQGEITAIKLVALSCRRALDDFYSSIKKYEESLSVVSRTSRARSSMKSLQWSLLMQSDVAKLRSYLESHIGTLNILITAELLKSNSEYTMIITKNQRELKNSIEEKWGDSRKVAAQVAKDADNHHLITQEKLDISQKLLTHIEAIVTNSELQNKKIYLITEQLGEQTRKELLPGVNAIIASAKKIQELQDNTTRMLQTTLPPPDPRFTWAQSPVYLEDALGRSILIPSEYNYDMLEAVIIARFKKGPGHEKVHSGDFELFNSYDSSDIICESKFQSTGLLPGMRITMAIIIGQYATDKVQCARFTCKSLRFREADQGGKTCLQCNTWFDRSQKKLCHPQRPDSGAENRNTRRSPTSPQLYRASSLKLSSDRKSYRNIRLYTMELPSTKALQRSRFGGSLRKRDSAIDTLKTSENKTFTDIPGSWLRDDGEDLRSRHTTHHFVEATTSNQLCHTNIGDIYEKKTAKTPYSKEPSKDFLVGLDASVASIKANLYDYAIAAQSIKTHKENDLATERAKALDIGDWTLEDWASIDQHQIDKLQDIGEGAGGTVAKCVILGHETAFAVKHLKGSSELDRQKQILRELRFNRECDSEWICKYYGAYFDLSGYHLCIAMEFCEGSSLDRVNQSVKAMDSRISEKVLWKIASSVLNGLTYLHSKCIIHRDIKPGNILFCRNGQVKIADFGAAGEFGKWGTAGTLIGTSYYMAPERITGQSYTITSDVWSLGISLFETAQTRHPYDDRYYPRHARWGLIDLLSTIVRAPIPKLSDEPELGVVWSEGFKYFIECCLEKDPCRRASPWRMLEHPWMTQMKGKRVNMEKFLKVVWGWE